MSSTQLNSFPSFYDLMLFCLFQLQCNGDLKACMAGFQCFIWSQYFATRSLWQQSLQPWQNGFALSLFLSLFLSVSVWSVFKLVHCERMYSSKINISVCPCDGNWNIIVNIYDFIWFLFLRTLFLGMPCSFISLSK